MVDINRLLNGTSSGLIAQKLDELDGNKNGRIEASIWNEFVKDKGGKEVSKFISIEDAMRSICHYAVKNGKTDADNLAAGWLRDATEQVAQKKSQTAQNSDPAPAQQTQPTQQTPANEAEPQAEAEVQQEAQPQASGQPTKQEQINADYQSVKVTVPKKTVTAKLPQNKAEVDAIVANQKQAKTTADEIRAVFNKDVPINKYYIKELRAELEKIDKDNAAYILMRIDNLVQVIDSIDGLWGSGFDKKEVIEYLLKPLAKKAEELGINKIGNLDRSQYLAFANQVKLADMEKDIKALAKQIRDIENGKVKKYNEQVSAYNAEHAKVNTHNKNLAKIQKTFDDATKFLAEVANMDPKPGVKEGSNADYNWKTAKLQDGRWIEVRYDKSSGEITAIYISNDTTPDTNSDGTKYDGAEVKFSKKEAWYENDKSNGKFEDNITSGYKFEDLKALAKKIFG